MALQLLSSIGVVDPTTFTWDHLRASQPWKVHRRPLSSTAPTPAITTVYEQHVEYSDQELDGARRVPLNEVVPAQPLKVDGDSAPPDQESMETDFVDSDSSAATRGSSGADSDDDLATLQGSDLEEIGQP